ncbi:MULTISPECIES: Fur family transcriptional regulator [unclassified Paracoccus (in: a-proteobacteria)]|uniref:Fur family transcriptional regulator n=1 Tax=unclassified Paracoccus (in: a-proteobacteria) TaxID=2688777 RepID=UPI0012B25670|nr:MULTISPECIES: Fur family transcriptional regulator [unclassified Paracoccus (in: a-proteobacteria)]UXU75006.1 transcriptional repressor [Paracoccus sp. SMMA_5]UXU80909.1 transcriptional repressor [Paracoccus sp. SMMA_5_TC]
MNETCGPGDAFHDHDHAHCAAEVLRRAEDQAQRDGVRLTPVRRRALEILLESHRAMGAYEVLERLAAEGFGRQPPVAYRALDFLVDQGLAHRVQRLNAYVACLSPQRDHSPAFLICRGCHRLAEAETTELQPALAAMAGSLGFRTERASVELLGLCQNCQEAGA